MDFSFEQFRNSTDFYSKMQEWNAKQQAVFAGSASISRVFSNNFY